LLFVGRIQPLKGVDVAVRSLAALPNKDAVLLVVGGASGSEGETELARVKALIDELGVSERVKFVAPQEHHILSTYYRAADAVLVPSRSESFGLVALEAAACGTPVVANAVGGLLTIVEHGRTGFLVPDRDPELFAKHTSDILENVALADALSRNAADRARQYTWSFAAARLRRVYADLASRDRVICS
jgi:D-inositol-3-phosphate glycosyltransferase